MIKKIFNQDMEKNIYVLLYTKEKNYLADYLAILKEARFFLVCDILVENWRDKIEYIG